MDRKTRMEGERKIEIGRNGVRDDRRKIKNIEEKRGSQRLRG